MNAITNQAKLVDFLRTDEQIAATDAIRHAQSSMLSELPGAAFAVITLAWIMMSFAQLL